MSRKCMVWPVLFVLAVGCGHDESTPASAGPAAESAPPEPGVDPSQEPLLFSCACDQGFTPSLDPTVRPVDVDLEVVSDCEDRNPGCQRCFDCFGWQLLVASSWPAGAHGQPDPSKPFGEPGDKSPVVWETFADARVMFEADELPAWDERTIAKRFHSDLRGKMQADHYWLTDGAGNLLNYEIRVNQDLYDYIRTNKLNTADGLQRLYADTNGPGLVLPAGGQDSEGTIEIKAAWRLVPVGQEAYFEANYKVSEATIDRETRLVALVGLHIAKKTPKLHQWAWATFEHVDNVPNPNPSAPPDPDRRYSFYDASRGPNYQPNWNAPPDAHGGTPRDRPVQVQREPDLDIGKEAKIVNAYMSAQIARRFPNSVWRNYRLVNVQWPMTPSELDGRLSVPAKDGDPRPQIVANLTMETYMQHKGSGGFAGVGYSRGDPGLTPLRNPEDQGKSSCIGCHRLGAITPPLSDGKSYFTDFSTIFAMAK